MVLHPALPPPHPIFNLSRTQWGKWTEKLLLAEGHPTKSQVSSGIGTQVFLVWYLSIVPHWVFSHHTESFPFEDAIGYK